MVTLKSLEGGQIDDFAVKLYKRWGIGQKGKDNGVLLVVAIDDRKARIEVGYGLEPILPDALAGRVLNEQLFPAFRQKRYAEGLTAAVNRVAEIIERTSRAGGDARAGQHAGGVPDSDAVDLRRDRLVPDGGRRPGEANSRRLVLPAVCRGSAVDWMCRRIAVGAAGSCPAGADCGRPGLGQRRQPTRLRAGIELGHNRRTLVGFGLVFRRRVVFGGWLVVRRRIFRRRERLGGLWRGQLRRRRGERRLVIKKDRAMNTEQLLKELQEAIGPGLKSVVLYGSAASGDFVQGVSAYDVLIVAEKLGASDLAAPSVPLARWEAAGNPMPQLFTPEELAASADVFPIELVDMQQSRRVLMVLIRWPKSRSICSSIAFNSNAS